MGCTCHVVCVNQSFVRLQRWTYLEDVLLWMICYSLYRYCINNNNNNLDIKGYFKNVVWLHRVSQEIVVVVFLGWNNDGFRKRERERERVRFEEVVFLFYLLLLFFEVKMNTVGWRRNVPARIHWSVLSMSLSAAFFEENESLMIFFFFFLKGLNYLKSYQYCTVLYCTI